MKALAKLAAPKDVAGMIPAVLKAEPGEERDSAEKAVMLVCLQEPRANERATPIVAALEKAAAADRVALLPLLGRVGGPAAMQRIQAALADADAATYDAGVRALANWPDGSVAADLLKLARTAKTEPQRHAALHGLIRVAVLPGKADADKLALLKEAMGMASRDEERNYVLQRAGAVRTVESLRFILPAMEQPALSQQACKSVCELAHHKELRNPNLAEFKPALDKVLKVSTDAATLERARRYLQGN
jgi:hypothetical protein